MNEKKNDTKRVEGRKMKKMNGLLVDFDTNYLPVKLYSEKDS